MNNLPLRSQYPCPAPFSQLYVVPRRALDLRFCSYHAPIYVHDQEQFYKQCPEALQKFFQDNGELRKRRKAFLDGDYERAGCSTGCYWYQQWKTTGKGFALDAYKGPDGTLRVGRLWLTIGPDCNVTCRYCLEPSEFRIDFNTCSPSVMNMAEQFVANGGEILLTGGEPFLPRFRLLQALERLAAKDQQGMGWFEIHTNATFLDEKCRDAILRGPVRVINVSMDTLRPELFEYLRRGCRFEKVWGNACSLGRERDAHGLTKPSLVILCAVMRATYDHLAETVAKVVEQGMAISLNALFKGHYSPDFCREQSLTTLSVNRLESLEKVVESFEATYGKDGPVQCQGFLGQLRELISAKLKSGRGRMVTLGGGGEAPRKHGIIGLLVRGRLLMAARAAFNLAQAMHARIQAAIGGIRTP